MPTTLSHRPLPGGPAPFIVPFALHRIMSGIACARNVELKRKARMVSSARAREREREVTQCAAAMHRVGMEFGWQDPLLLRDPTVVYQPSFRLLLRVGPFMNQ